MAHLILLHNNINLPNVRAERHYRERIDPELDNFTDEELRARYRVGRETLHFIVNLLRQDLERPSVRNHALSVSMQVCIALRFYASGSFLQVIGDTLGLDKSTVSRVVRDVSLALVAKKEQFIKWPSTEQQKRAIKEGFFTIGHFPNVIGAVDGTHVRIIAPSEHENMFVNRKGLHSINVQGICDDQGRFTNIVATWPGSSHDSYIFRNSNICQYFEQHFRHIEDGMLIGDSGYACRPFLMTPYLAPANVAQERFNTAHKTTRVTVERMFGRWKRRFHVLHSEIRMVPERVCIIIGACAVMHNICILLGDAMEDAEENERPDRPNQHAHVGQQDGRAVREYIVHNYFA